MSFDDQEFTAAQNEAMEKVSDILREHFSASVFAVVTDIENKDGQEVSTAWWHGGRVTGLGLAHLAVRRLTEHHADDDQHERK